MKNARSNFLGRMTMPLLVWSCLTLGFASGAAQALPITKSLTVNVVTVCADDGTNCASQGPAGDLFFAAETNKIWAQAGIAINFVLQANLNDSDFLDIDDAVAGKTFFDLSGGPNLGGTQTMWLVHTVDGAYGEAWFDAGGLVIAMDDVMAYNGGIGRLDTIAHEIGHNLGLVGPAIGGDAGGHDNSNHSFLMASGGVRNVPSSLSEICPDGPCYDLLSSSQIAVARSSFLLRDVQQSVPEPASVMLLGAGLLACAATRRRQNNAAGTAESA